MKRFSALLLLSLLSCSIYHTYYRYTFTLPDNQPFPKKVCIAPLNLLEGAEDSSIIHSSPLHRQIVGYFERNKIDVVQDTTLKAKWHECVIKSGGMYDPISGKVNPSIFAKTLLTFIVDVSREDSVEAIIFPAVVSTTAYLYDQFAYWDGVCREIIFNVAFQNVSTYNFSGTDAGLSLKALIFTPQGDLIFKSLGGIELANEIVNNHNGKKSVLRNDLLRHFDWNDEAIQIAFHPFIKMKGYPHHPNFAKDPSKQ
jgi:hypothetical protein